MLTEIRYLCSVPSERPSHCETIDFPGRQQKKSTGIDTCVQNANTNIQKLRERERDGHVDVFRDEKCA